MTSEIFKPDPGQTVISRGDFDEEDFLALEAAEQLGFIALDDDCQVYLCTDEAIVELVHRCLGRPVLEPTP